MTQEQNSNEAQPSIVEVHDLLHREDLDGLKALATDYPAFPNGIEPGRGRRWIRHALHCGTLSTIQWMIEQGVDLESLEEHEDPLLLEAMRRKADQHEVLKLLLDAGAPVNQQSLNYTALHQAAYDEDLKAIQILLDHGADPLIETEIDLFATPLQEAIYFGKQASAQYLMDHCVAWARATRETIDKEILIAFPDLRFRPELGEISFDRVRVEPYLHPIFRYGRLDHVWVVTQQDSWVIYFDDIVQGFFDVALPEPGQPLINQSGEGLFSQPGLAELVSRHLS